VYLSVTYEFSGIECIELENSVKMVILNKSISKTGHFENGPEVFQNNQT
jgi:hypothetical protein